MNSKTETPKPNVMPNMPNAETDLFDLFEDSVDVVNDETETEEDLIRMDDSKSTQEECEFGMSVPVSNAETGSKEMAPVKAEVVETVTPVAIKVTGTSAPQIWMPCLPSSLSAQTLFNLALNVEPFDPARQMLGFHYEQRLRYECKLLIPHPIPSYYRRGIWKALMIRRNNPGFFICNAIDVVLTYYFNNFYPEDNDVFS